MKLFLLALLSLPLSLFAQGGLPDRPYIYVQGRGEIEKPADMVTLRFSLNARDADQAKANQQVQANATKVFAMLDGRKIAKNDVLAEELNSAAEYDESESYPRNRGKLIGYRVTRPFAVKLRDVTLLPKLVNELLALVGTEFSSIDAGLSDEDALKDAVWEKALSKAREQAEKTLAATGMKIDSVFAISPVAFPEIRAKLLGGAHNEMMAMAARDVVGPPPAEYRLPPIEITQTVHMIYLISSAR